MLGIQDSVSFSALLDQSLDEPRLIALIGRTEVKDCPASQPSNIRFAVLVGQRDALYDVGDRILSQFTDTHRGHGVTNQVVNFEGGRDGYAVLQDVLKVFGNIQELTLWPHVPNRGNGIHQQRISYFVVNRLAIHHDFDRALFVLCELRTK